MSTDFDDTVEPRVAPGDDGTRLSALEAEVRGLRAGLAELVEEMRSLRGDLKAARGLAADVDRIRALAETTVRRLSIDHDTLPWPERLTARRFGMSSQKGEDGLLLAILQAGGQKHRRFAELGCGDNGGNTAFLARELGWKGLLVDGDGRALKSLRQELRPRGVRVTRAWVSREDVNELLERHGAGGELDVLSIDIDGNDLWVWEAITVVQPRVVVVEYNTALGHARSVAVPYDPDFVRDPSRVMGRYYGASLEALARVGQRKGYRLVACENVNAFFVRADVARQIPAVPVRRAYRLYHKDAARLRRIGDIFEAFERENLELVEVE